LFRNEESQYEANSISRPLCVWNNNDRITALEENCCYGGKIKPTVESNALIIYRWYDCLVLANKKYFIILIMHS